MRLDKVRIEGYRSLKSLAWQPHALNVFIGANASGKSNLLHALG
jgi:predicted ATP-dependent endonuclease of OLD family